MVAVACLAGVLVAPLGVAAQEAERSRLSQAQQELERIADELAEAESRVDEREEALADADERLAEIEAVVNRVATRVEEQRAAVGDAERQLAEVEGQAEDLASQFGDRIARLYMQGPDLTLEAFLSSSGAEEAIARTTMLERVTHGDQIDLEHLGAAATRVDAQRERLVVEEERLADLLEEQEALLADAEELRASRALAAADARERAETLASQHDDLEDEEADLKARIQEHEEEQRRQARAAERSQAASSPTPSAGSGGFAWPMCAPVTSGYGPRWGRMHRGIDFGAPTGTPIAASRAGTVISAGWQGGYGNLVLIDHHNGVITAYAHLSRFAVGSGQSVSQGQVIGHVGSTGNSTGPHLHFETRVNGSAVNPRQYLSGSPC